jgi:hypothetical protein
MNNIRFEELIEACENYQAHVYCAAKIATISAIEDEYKSYLKNLSRLIKSTMESDDPKLLLSASIVLPILYVFLQTRTRYGLKYVLYSFPYEIRF